MRIDAMTPTHASNLERAHEGTTRGANAVAFREVLASVMRESLAPHASETHTPTAWTATDAEAFAVFVEANRRTESGGVASFSTLRTTAGATHRASYGLAQLSVREHLSHLARQSDADLARWGTSRPELDTMRRRGEATVAFYHLLVDGRDLAASASVVGIDASERAVLATLAEAGDTGALRERIGPRFERATGIPASAIDELVLTRALRDPAMREAFSAQYAHDHGVAFDPAHRDGARMAETARHLAIAHPDMARALAMLGGDDTAATSLGHYLGVGDSAENLLGWHARAASTVVGQARFGSLLASIDSTTSHAREIADFEHALAAIAGIGDLAGAARVGTLARIGRIFHGSPTRAREALFVDGRLDSPRCRSHTELDALLDQLRSGRTWSDTRLAEHVARVVTERSGA